MSGEVDRAARAILDAFHDFGVRFNEITRRAGRRFAARDWSGDRADVGERLELYGESMREIVAELRRLLGPRIDSQATWREIKPAYAPLAGGERNRELVETYFNSVTRRIFSTVGVNPQIEFIEIDPPALPAEADPAVIERIEPRETLAATLAHIVASRGLAVEFADLAGDCELAAREVERQLGRATRSGRVAAIELLRPLFYRDRGAYVVGRIRGYERTLPLVIALRHRREGVAVDAVMTYENEVSILFSFTRAYFHVVTDSPRDLIVFLRSIMPLKPLSELYTSIGLHKHGKTVLYRDLLRHLVRSRDRFRTAEGDRGMVMLVFTLPTYDIVFKVIRDTFDYPKTTTRDEVRERYRLVSKHDRVGRLVDAQEFEHLTFDQALFDEALLREMTAEAGETVSLRGEEVAVSHLYTERKITPLNVFLRRADELTARRTVVDYGRAIKELAAANIFPGDFLLKNFGVTRHGRVVFYDYDELCLLTECRFRRMPAARTPEEEMSPEPWFSVGPNDIFPEEFRRFVGLQEPLRSLFEERHGDLFDVAFWRDLQQRHLRGETPDFYPYPQKRRLRPR